MLVPVFFGLAAVAFVICAIWQDPLRLGGSRELGRSVLASLEANPQDWRFNGYTISKGDLSIWISNRPYADLTIHPGGVLVGCWTQRRRIRKALDGALTAAALRKMEPKG